MSDSELLRGLLEQPPPVLEVELPYKWNPRSYQHNVWEYFMQRKRRGRAVCLWHRRAGKDLMAVNLISVKAMERVGTYWHIFPTYKQGKNVAWIGSTREGRRFRDHFHPSLVENVNNTDLRVDFCNGSSYQVVGSDNIDSLVGTNPIGCVFSEYSLHDPAAWDYIRPILSENDGWALFIYTARGRNHGYRMYHMAKKNPEWFCELLYAGNEGTKREDGTPVISDATIEEERAAGMPEELIQQEYYNSFDSPMVGAYYAQQMDMARKDGRVGKVPHDPLLPVDTYWDLGVGDSTSIWFIQSVGQEHRVIDYFEKSGEGIPYYLSVLTGKAMNSEHRRAYNYRNHFAPHDIQVREYTTGRSRIETARSLGISFRVVPLHSVEDGIEAVRNLLPLCWFDEKRCERGLDGLGVYRKEFDTRKQVYGDKPVHDWSSHPADAFRMFAWSTKRPGSGSRKPQFSALDDFDYLRGH